MQSKKVELYISKICISQMEDLARMSFPLETGGLLIGYISKSDNIVVVTDIIGSGPKAKHQRYSFVPDYDYQECEIKRIYNNSNRTSVYIGDWHTHPGGGSMLSNTDVQTMKHISNYPEARAPFPIMAILSGVSGSWEVKFWQLKYNKFVIRFDYKIINLNYLHY